MRTKYDECSNQFYNYSKDGHLTVEILSLMTLPFSSKKIHGPLLFGECKEFRCVVVSPFGSRVIDVL